MIWIINHFIKISIHWQVHKGFDKPDFYSIFSINIGGGSMISKNKLSILREIESEKKFRDQVLEILFKKMGYKGVEIIHGSQEHGKDIVFYEIDKRTNSEINYAVVVKLGKLKAGSGADRNNIVNVYTQVSRAFSVSYDDPIRRRKIKPNRVWVVTNGNITPSAKKEILAYFGNERGIVERNVEFFDDRRLVDIIDKYWPDYFISDEPFLMDYCAKVNSSYRELIELRSLGYSHQDKSLDEIYIEPTLIEKREREVKGSKKEKKGKKRKLPFTVHEQNEILAKNYDVWLIGQPGSGKSTMIRDLAIRLADDLRSGKIHNKIPVLISFKDLIEDNVIIPIEKKVLEFFENENLLGYTINPSEWLNNGRIIIFVDGLDEISNTNFRFQLIDSINQFKNNYNNVKIVGSCRDIGFEPYRHKLNKFRIVEIMPFNFKQIKSFVERWFKKNENTRKKMIDAVKASMLSGNLPKTPMVLTLLAIIFEESTYRELPANLTELYSMFTQLLLGRWDISRKIETFFQYNIKENILKNLAFSFQLKGKDNISEIELIQFIEAYSEERKAGILAQKLIDEIEKRSNLLIKVSGKYQFKHLSFQEYFASQQWMLQNNIEKEITKKALDSWWQNVIFFYFGTIKDAPHLIDAVIKKSEPKTIPEELSKYLNIGLFLQAAYLTNHAKKVEALHYVFNNYYNLVQKIWHEYEKKDEYKISELLFLLIMEHFFVSHFSSITLKEAMIDIFKSFWDNAKPVNKEVFYNCLMLAHSLAMLEFPDYIEELATYPGKMDTIFLPILDMNIELISDEYGTKFDKKVIAKLKKRIRKSAKAIKSFLGN